MITALADLPDRDDVREWVERELDKSEYRQAEPTLFDRVAKAIADFFSDLFSPDIGGAAWSPVWTIVIVAVILAAIVIAFVIWGRPRTEHRGGPRPSATVLDGDERSAADLRRDARAARERGDADLELILRFRAIARGLDERGVLHAPPGMTARVLAASASEFFPGHASGLQDAASWFDDVRYLRRHATAERAVAVADLDDAIAKTRPAKTAEAMFA